MATQKKEQNTFDLNAIRENLTENARQVWLAGLGALASVEDEGNKLFDQLVKKGTDFEKKGEDKINSTYKEISGEVEKNVKKVGDAVNEQVEKVTESFEGNVSKVLEKVGVPTFGEVKDLISKVEDLTKKVDALSKKVESEKSAPKAEKAPAQTTPKVQSGK